MSSQPSQLYNYSNWEYEDDKESSESSEDNGKGWAVHLPQPINTIQSHDHEPEYEYEYEYVALNTNNEAPISYNPQYKSMVPSAGASLERQDTWTTSTPLFNSKPNMSRHIGLMSTAPLVDNTKTIRRRKPPPLSSSNSVELPVEATFDLSPPPAPTTESYPTMSAWSLPFTGESTNIWSTQYSITEQNSEGRLEHALQPCTTQTPITNTEQNTYSTNYRPLYEYGKFRYTLETIEEKDSWGGQSKEYLAITDILYHATLGGTISHCYLDELTKHVTEHVPIHDTIELEQTNVCGIVFKRRLPVFSFEQYSSVAFRCLEWVLSNPEKIGKGSYH